MKMRKILLLVTIIIFTFAFAGCGSNGGGSDQKETSASVTDGIQGVIFSVPDDWTKDEVSKDTAISYANPAGDLTIGVSAVDKSNLEGFADIREIKTVEEYYKYRTSPSKDDVNEKEFESASLLGQDGKTAKIKNGDGYVDVATYCMLDGVMYDFFIYRNYADDRDGKIKPETKVLSEEDLAAYEDFVESAKTGDGASLQMKGMKADHLGELNFSAPEGFTPTDIGHEYVGFEGEKGTSLGVSMVDKNNLEYYTKENGTGYASLEEYFKEFTEGKKKTKIAGYDGFISDEGEEAYDQTASIMTKDAVYTINMWPTDYEDENAKLSEDDKAAFDSFIKSIKIN